MSLHQSQQHGKIILIVGPMMAGKTELMLSKVTQHHHKNRKCCFVKFDKDNRYDSIGETSETNKTNNQNNLTKPKIYTHNLNSNHNNITVFSTSSISAVFDKLKDFDVIGVSEAQFFDDIELVDVLAKKRVIVCEGLSSSHTRENLGSLYKLYPLVEEIIFLKAICACGLDACFTKKIKGSSDQMVEIGGSEMYTSLCRNCFF